MVIAKEALLRGNQHSWGPSADPYLFLIDSSLHVLYSFNDLTMIEDALVARGNATQVLGVCCLTPELLDSSPGGLSSGQGRGGNRG